MSKPIVVEVVGGRWDGEVLRTDSPVQQERFLAAECYEMSHHGRIGEECVGLCDEDLAFARKHAWNATKEPEPRGRHRYLVTERRENRAEIAVTIMYE